MAIQISSGPAAAGGNPGTAGTAEGADEAPAAGPDGRAYGDGDASYQAAGGQVGIDRLVDRFYDLMESRPDAQAIRRMHPRDLAVSRDKLKRFLSGWLGGPKLFAEKYGPIQIPKAHARFNIAAPERDAWLACMEEALESQPYAEPFKAYLMRELFVPADRIRQAVASRISADRVDLPSGE